jgi:hypothetical protein
MCHNSMAVYTYRLSDRKRHISNAIITTSTPVTPSIWLLLNKTHAGRVSRSGRAVTWHIGARFVTDTRHFHWRSVKLAYLIGRGTGHLLPMPTSPNIRFVTGLSGRQHSDFELDWMCALVIGYARTHVHNVLGGQNMRYIKCFLATKMHVCTAVT